MNTPTNSRRDSVESPVLFGIGDTVTVAHGASKWMRERGFWIHDWPTESIDGMEMQVVADYTHLGGDSSHWWLENETVRDCGVHPQFVLPNEHIGGIGPDA